MGALDGVVGIVTGASGGIGAAIVSAMVAEGAKVVATDIAAPHGDHNVLGLAHDVTNKTRWHEVVAEGEEAFGAITTLVNNAGIVLAGSLEETTEEDYRRVIDVNQVGVFLGMQAVVPSMKKAGGGSIINIASMDGIVAHPGIYGYSSSKFAVRGLTKVAALELGQWNIRVNAVCPGYIATPMTEGIPSEMTSAVALGRIGEPKEIAGMVSFLASPLASYATGTEFIIDGGYTAK